MPLIEATLPLVPRHLGGAVDELPTFLGDPASNVYSLAHQQLHEMEAREKRVVLRIAQEREKFKAKATYLASEHRKLDDTRASYSAA
jgi:hypothetical protein